jgi:hypothetical protein
VRSIQDQETGILLGCSSGFTAGQPEEIKYYDPNVVIGKGKQGPVSLVIVDDEGQK